VSHKRDSSAHLTASDVGADTDSESNNRLLHKISPMMWVRDNIEDILDRCNQRIHLWVEMQVVCKCARASRKSLWIKCLCARGSAFDVRCSACHARFACSAEPPCMSSSVGWSKGEVQDQAGQRVGMDHERVLCSPNSLYTRSKRRISELLVQRNEDSSR
jgi:hypothetical protein